MSALMPQGVENAQPSEVGVVDATIGKALELRAKGAAQVKTLSSSLQDKSPRQATEDDQAVQNKTRVTVVANVGAKASNHTSTIKAKFLPVVKQLAVNKPAENRSLHLTTPMTERMESSTTTKPQHVRPNYSEYPLPYLHGEWPTKYENRGRFPNGFVWGMGTAAYQIEGAYREDGRGASIWDTFTGADTVGMPGANCSYCCQHAPCTAHWAMKDTGATGNVAADHYHLWKTDVALMKAMGLKHYRFSLSWPRLIPTGKLKDGKNQKGIDFYNSLINELHLAGITPYVTIYHWDLPQGLLDPPSLQAWWSRDADGKPDGQILPDWLDYVNLCFTEFGDRVKSWVTFNEPWTFLFLGSGYGKAPSIEYFSNMTIDPWIGGHNVLNAHAAAVDLYRRKFQKKQRGLIGITNNCDWREPKTDSPEDILAAEHAVLFQLGWFAEPIFGSTGDYPASMRKAYGSQLPEFTEEQRALLKGSSDFFGLNHYGTGWVAHDKHHPGADLAYAKLTEEGLPGAQSTWLYGAAWGFRKVLNWVSSRYDNPPLLVTEGGWSLKAETAHEAVHDQARVVYYANYTSEMYKAIFKDGVHVLGYFAWSLMDNFEWDQGYTERFGATFTEYNFGLDPNAPTRESSQPTEGKQMRQRKESSCWLEAVWAYNELIGPKSVNYDGCTSSLQFHGEFMDPTQPECTRMIVVHAPGTSGSLFEGCGDESSDSPSAPAVFSGSSIVADFSARGGPSHLVGFWNRAKNSIMWGDGSLWMKIYASGAHVDFNFRK